MYLIYYYYFIKKIIWWSYLLLFWRVCKRKRTIWVSSIYNLVLTDIFVGRVIEGVGIWGGGVGWGREGERGEGSSSLVSVARPCLTI